MNDSLTPFHFEGNTVRTIADENDVWFVLADVCRALDLSNPSMVATRIDQDALSSTEVIDSLGRRQTATTINEGGLYEVVFLSRKAEARQFKRWVTRDVLPAIRRTGSYSAAPAMPQSYAEALRELASTVEANAALEAKVAADAPKVLFADAVATSQTDILVGDLAKVLRGNGLDEMGANRLFDRLRTDGYLIRRKGSDWNMPTQRAMELGLFRIKETAITHSDGHVTVSKTPKVTGKGQAYFVNRYAPRRRCQTR